MTTEFQRIARMRRTFAKNRSILVEDYEYFTMPHESIRQNKVEHKSAEPSGRQSLKQSETPSSDKIGD